MKRQERKPPETGIVAYIGLGSNLGDRRANLRRAVCEIERLEGLRLIALSSFYESKPVGPEDQPDFMNAAAAVRTPLAPRSLLETLQTIEAAMGRRRLERWGPRNIDLDILLYDDFVLSEPDLVVPHPLMHLRRFVLAPLCEIAPDARHPVLGMSVRELLARLDEGHGRTKLPDWRQLVSAL